MPYFQALAYQLIQLLLMTICDANAVLTPTLSGTGKECCKGSLIRALNILYYTAYNHAIKQHANQRPTYPNSQLIPVLGVVVPRVPRYLLHRLD